MLVENSLPRQTSSVVSDIDRVSRCNCRLGWWLNHNVARLLDSKHDRTAKDWFDWRGVGSVSGTCSLSIPATALQSAILVVIPPTVRSEHLQEVTKQASQAERIVQLSSLSEFLAVV